MQNIELKHKYKTFEYVNHRPSFICVKPFSGSPLADTTESSSSGPPSDLYESQYLAEYSLDSGAEIKTFRLPFDNFREAYPLRPPRLFLSTSQQFECVIYLNEFSSVFVVDWARLSKLFSPRAQK